MERNKIVINTDGGARGNPGPAAIGVVLKSHHENEDFLYEFSEYIGETTNNEAEYKAVILGLEKAKEFLKEAAKETEIEFNTDSELVQKQIKGEYKVKMEHLKPLFNKVKKLMENFKKVDFKHVPRTQNKEADRLVNDVLDSL